ncbi:unnamed protein product [Meganyctiphanes norvegica]|uniref:Uncharacterized protein n=1 Tax=Meganyctiphanes norvegica TaxID=48144 RepID=A0AAV2RVQ4_MEGNR
MDDIVSDLDSGCGEDSSGGSPRPSCPLVLATQDSYDASTTRTAVAPTARASLKRRAESFSAGSLLARFHSSRKSESDIQGEGKKGTSCSGGVAGPRREICERNASDTSASLPDCLHQQVVGEGASGSQGSLQNPAEAVGDRELRGGSEDHVNDEVEVTEENSPFIDARNGSGLMDNWFLTWPGRQKSLKNFMKRKKNIGEKKGSVENNPIKPKDKKVPIDEDVHTFCGSDKDIAKVLNMETQEKLTGHVSLDALLESLPLVYDPTTKQLCIGRENNSLNGSRRPPIRSQSLPSDESDLDKNGYEHTVPVDFPTENESQKELLIKHMEACSPSYLESIQEQDECSEGARLMRASPTSGTGGSRGHFESPRNSLPRVSTTTSLSMTDASSFSSLSSSNTELSLYSASDSAVCLGSHLSDTSSLHSFTDADTKLKRKGITEFLSR